MSIPTIPVLRQGRTYESLDKTQLASVRTGEPVAEMEQAGVPVSYYPLTDALGVVLPSNSPGVNSLWMPAVALKVPVVLKPGREEPWTPFRIIQAFIQAGCPPEAFSFYPTDHEGSGAVLEGCCRDLA